MRLIVRKIWYIHFNRSKLPQASFSALCPVFILEHIELDTDMSAVSADKIGILIYGSANGVCLHFPLLTEDRLTHRARWWGHLESWPPP